MGQISFFHAPSPHYFRDRDLVLQLAVPDGDDAVSKIELIATLSKKSGEPQRHTYRMLPVDGFTSDESYSVYSATLPRSVFRHAQKISYFFRYAGTDSAVYTAQISDKPAFPPLLLTETALWNKPQTSFVELYNTTDAPLDLYDFELFYTCGEAHARMALADARGESILPAGALCALRFRTAALLNKFAPKELGRDEFFGALAAEYPISCGDLFERDILFFEKTVAEKTAAGFQNKEQCCELYPKYYPYTLLLLPRGGKAEYALCVIEANNKPGVRHSRFSRSTLWYYDASAPRRAVFETADCEPTPGFVCEGQVLPCVGEAPLPVIIPLAPQEKVMLAGGRVTFRFAAIGGAMGRARVWVRGTDRYRAYPAGFTTSGVFEASIDVKELVLFGGAIEYFLELSDGTYTVREGSERAPLVAKAVDNIGPEILSVYPAHGEALENVYLPEITLSYRDSSGVNTRSSTVCLDGYNISRDAEWGKGTVTVVPQKPLAKGRHVLEISLRDMLGNRTYQKTEFSVCDGTQLRCFRGQIHSHSIDSDGEGTPAEAFTYARDVGGVDFFALTDHSHYMTAEDLSGQKKLAEGFDRPLEFAAMAGFEMTWNNKNGYFGHMNVLESKWMCHPRDTDLARLYQRLESDPTALAMFNHPCTAWGNFNDFEGHTAALDRSVCLIEVNSKSFEEQYALALAKGFRVAPLCNEDNHKRGWTTSGAGIGVVLAPVLTRANMLSAMRQRRTYTTTDRTLEIYFRANGTWLGGELCAPTKLVFDTLLRTKNEKGIGKIELVSEDGIVVACIDAGPVREFFWQVELDPDFDYYYLRVQNGELYALTAPIFVSGRDQLAVTQIESGVCKENDDFFVVSATVKNQGEKSLQEVEIDFYLTPSEGFVLRELTPFATVEIGKLAPGEAKRVSRSFPCVPGSPRVSALAHGMQGKSRYADTAFLRLSPVTVSKMMPSTSSIELRGKTVQNPFAYIELYNPSPKTVSLSGYSLRLWESIGVPPREDRILHLDGAHIAAGSTLTIWVRPEKSGLTVADFNHHYGTTLVEGEDLFVSAVRVLCPRPEGRMLELFRGKELLARANYGFYCTRKPDVKPDTPCLYATTLGMTVTQKQLPPPRGENPLPGQMVPRQLPLIFNERPYAPDADPQKSASPKRVLTKLFHAPLVPLRLASLAISTLSAFKGLFSDKK